MKLIIELELDSHPHDFVQGGELSDLLADIGRTVEDCEYEQIPLRPINYRNNVIGCWRID